MRNIILTLLVSILVPTSFAFANQEVDLHMTKGTLAFRKGDWDAAKVQFSEVIKLDRQNASAFYYLGLVSLRKNDAENAVSYLRVARRLRKEDAKIQLNYAIALAGVGKYRLAAKELDGEPEAHKDLTQGEGITWRYYKGVSLLAINNESGKKELTKIRNNTLLPAYAEAARSLLGGGPKQSPGPAPESASPGSPDAAGGDKKSLGMLYANLGIQYDSNVLLEPDDLSPGEEPMETTDTREVLILSGTYKPYEDDALGSEVGGRLYQSYHNKGNETAGFNVTNLGGDLRGWYSFKAGYAQRFSLSYSLDSSSIGLGSEKLDDGSGGFQAYSVAHKLAANHLLLWQEMTYSTLGVTHTNIEFEDRTALFSRGATPIIEEMAIAGNDGVIERDFVENRLDLGQTLRLLKEGQNFALTLTLGLNYVSRESKAFADAFYGYEAYGGRFTTQYLPPVPNLKVTLGVAYAQEDHKDDPLPNTADPNSSSGESFQKERRVDSITDFRLVVGYDILKELVAELSVQQIDHGSTSQKYDYTRTISGLAFAYTFTF